ncbi:MAG: arginase family protein [Chloroflexota bacterium]|nr:arginase family protein [Chloroflexota bacterium]
MPRYAIVDAPTNLGLRPGGVERLGEALLANGLADRLGAGVVARVEPAGYDSRRDPETMMLNPAAIADHARRLADVVAGLVADGVFPVVLGGDCSILLGATLGLNRLGRHGLFFLDGHADFYQADASATGELADMELGIVTGRGPAVVADIEGRRPYVRDEDTVVFGCRDAAEATAAGSRDVRASRMRVFDAERARELGVTTAAAMAVQPDLGLHRQGPLADGVAGFWIHLDADVLDDGVMPAVDYRQPGGLSPAEVREVLRLLLRTGRAVGLEVTIYHPSLDPTAAAGRMLASVIVDGLIGDRGVA